MMLPIKAISTICWWKPRSGLVIGMPFNWIVDLHLRTPQPIDTWLLVRVHLMLYMLIQHYLRLSKPPNMLIKKYSFSTNLLKHTKAGKEWPKLARLLNKHGMHGGLLMFLMPKLSLKEWEVIMLNVLLTLKTTVSKFTKPCARITSWRMLLGYKLVLMLLLILNLT